MFPNHESSNSAEQTDQGQFIPEHSTFMQPESQEPIFSAVAPYPSYEECPRSKEYYEVERQIVIQLMSMIHEVKELIENRVLTQAQQLDFQPIV